MSQQARNNPDSPEMQRASRDNERAVFAARMMLREPIEHDDDLDDDPEDRPTSTRRQRWLDGVDSGTNREYL